MEGLERRRNQHNGIQEINRQLGLISGTLQTAHASQMAALDVIRADIKRVEENTNARLTRIEDKFDSKLVKINDRIDVLEKDKTTLTVQVAKLGTISGVISAALVAGFVEYLKRV